MQITDLVGVIVRQVTGRLVRRLIAALLLALFALAALYHLTIAGILALESEVGAVNARLIIGGVFVVAALAPAYTLWSSRAKFKPRGEASELLNSRRDLQIAMIIEAVLLGLSLSRSAAPRRSASSDRTDAPPSPQTAPQTTPPPVA
jgi:hypothetical protein